MTKRLFFLSYARRDRDPFLDKFFEDLSTEVRICMGAEEDEPVGFMDVKNIEVGDEWDAELALALAECRVFVSLYTPAYFRSEFCGKEWSVFRARQEEQRPGAAGPGRPGLILPVLWTSEKTLSEWFPTVSQTVQYDQDFEPVYRREGLRFLSKQGRYSDQYELIVHRLAEKICEEARRADGLKPSAAIKSPREAENAFAGLRQAAAEPLAEAGTRFVKFILVAASREEVAQARVRNAVGGYGASGGIGWMPYWKDVTEDLALKAQGIAWECRLLSEVTGPEGDIVQLIRDAEKKNNIVVIIMDTWSLQLEKYRDMMQKWGEYYFYNCALLVPWNGSDDETLGARQRLVDRLAETFPYRVQVSRDDPERKITSFDQFCIVDGINRWEDLVSVLRESIKNVRARISMVSPYVSTAGPGQRPPAVF